jgi:hypothetical protein
VNTTVGVYFDIDNGTGIDGPGIDRPGIDGSGIDGPGIDNNFCLPWRFVQDRDPVYTFNGCTKVYHFNAP